MDRFRWCSDPVHLHGQLNSGEESVVLQQSGVRIYNGIGRTAFENGHLLLTSHRLIWSQTQQKHTSAIALPLSAIVNTKLQTSSGLTGSGTPKILVNLLSPKALETLFNSLPVKQSWMEDWIVGKSDKQVSMSSGIDFLRFGFTQCGHKEFDQALKETLQAKCWQVSTVSGSKKIRGSGGIMEIERQLAAKTISADKSISAAFEDLSQLMSKAGEMVALSRSLAQKMQRTKEVDGDVDENETKELRNAMLSMGLNASTLPEFQVDLTSKSATSFHGQLAVQLCNILHPMLTVKVTAATGKSKSQMLVGGCVDLTSAYCRINRARGVELVSPDDLLQAAQMMQSLKLPLRLKQFSSGVMVIQLASESDESMIKATTNLVEKHTCLSAGSLARLSNIAPILARERLLQAEEKGCVCRDDSEAGLLFYPNRFSTSVA